VLRHISIHESQIFLRGMIDHHIISSLVIIDDYVEKNDTKAAIRTVIMLEFVVDGLYVGDANAALVLNPRRSFAQNLVETLEHRHGELRPGVEV